MTGPVFTMLGDTDAVACVGDSCALPGSSGPDAKAPTEQASDVQAP